MTLRKTRMSQLGIRLWKPSMWRVCPFPHGVTWHSITAITLEALLRTRREVVLSSDIMWTEKQPQRSIEHVRETM